MNGKSVVLAVALCLLGCSGVPRSAPALEATRIGPARTDRLRDLFLDGELRLVGVDYGHADSPQRPGMYAQDQRTGRWIRLDRISLADAALGRAPTDEELRRAGKHPLMISWDFRPLASEPAVDLPLSSGGSLFFPDRVERDDDRGRLVLRYNSEWAMEPVETRLVIPLADLRAALATR